MCYEMIRFRFMESKTSGLNEKFLIEFLKLPI